MKCPKCGYLGFEPVDRCRNCGYDFSLATTPQPDLPIRLAANDGPLEELPLADPSLENSADRMGPGGSRGGRARDRGTPAELPLFGPADDAPLITRASPPRQPLAVRRATPEIPRLRAETRAPLEQPLPELIVEPPPRSQRTAPAIVVPPPQSRPAAPAREPQSDERATEAAAAPVVSRVVASLIDLLIVAAIDVPVVYLTLKICGLTFAEIGELPKVPLIAFLILLAVGYHVAFTAGGQTAGQLALGIRVVNERQLTAPGLTRAFVRTLAWMVSLLPAGLGLTSVLLDEQHRGLHDRFAATRVVRAAV